MIVMGSHGRAGIAHITLGSMAENVARKASCPDLIVKQSRRKIVMPSGNFYSHKHILKTST